MLLARLYGNAETARAKEAKTPEKAGRKSLFGQVIARPSPGYRAAASGMTPGPSGMTWPWLGHADV